MRFSTAGREQNELYVQYLKLNTHPKDKDYQAFSYLEDFSRRKVTLGSFVKKKTKEQKHFMAQFAGNFY